MGYDDHKNEMMARFFIGLAVFLLIIISGILLIII